MENVIGYIAEEKKKKHINEFKKYLDLPPERQGTGACGRGFLA